MTLEIRAIIALEAFKTQLEHTWGGMTRLAEEYQVSRTFIYSLLDTFKAGAAELFFPQEKPPSPTRDEAEISILTHRFEGKSSIDGISTLMKRDALPFASQGYISRFLTETGRCLPKVLTSSKKSVNILIFVSDEIFAKSIPILITVDPISSAILSIELADNRTADQWCQHYDVMIANGLQPKQAASDAGKGICSALQEKFPNIRWQLDTFHAVAHCLGDWNRRLERNVNAALQHAIDRENKLASAKSDPVIDKRLHQCFEADSQVDKAQQLHENFKFLYHEIVQQLNTFDSKGHLRDREFAKSHIETALELMESLGHQGLNRDIAKVRNALPHIFTYFDDAKIAVNQCQKLTEDEEVLTTLYLAWQWNKAVIKSKQTERRHKAIEQRDFYLELSMLFVDDEEEWFALKEAVYAELDQIIQASSMVECINSILRPYLNNAKNQVTQEFLNAFMFYHNHRRYHAGKRKGKTPMEILTGRPQTEDWATLMHAKVKEQRRALAA